MKTKEFIITLFFILIVLVLCGFFPAKKALQQMITLLVFFVILPLIFNKFFLKKGLGNLGIKLGDYKLGLIFSSASILIVVSILFLIVKYTNLLKHQIIPISIVHNFGAFIFYELVLVAFIVFVYEVFFRGFIMFNLVNKTSYYIAIAAQTLLFWLFIWATGSSLWEFLPYFVFAPVAGLIAFKSRSIIYSGVSQLLVLIFFHIIIIKIIGG